MSSLKDAEKHYFEKMFGMSGGDVLGYNNATFDALFKRYNINIHDQKYTTYGSSKAKKLREFWSQESDDIVACVLSEMLEYCLALAETEGREIDKSLLNMCRSAIDRLSPAYNVTEQPSKAFCNPLNREIGIPDLRKLPLDSGMARVVETRLEEVQKVLDADAPLAAIFLCGSILEGVLLAAAEQHQAEFNRSKSSPKTAENGKVKPFREWSLAQLIDVAHTEGLLNLDVKKFSHGLRDFRNYIHPREQLESGFTPDKHTAEICFNVLKAALASLAGER